MPCFAGGTRYTPLGQVGPNRVDRPTNCSCETAAPAWYKQFLALHLLLLYKPPGKPSEYSHCVVNVRTFLPWGALFRSVIGAMIMMAGIDPICSALHGREGRRELSRNVRPGILACP